MFWHVLPADQNELWSDLVKGGVNMGRSKVKRPTDDQAMIIAKNGLLVKDWLVLWESDDRLCLVNRATGHCRKIEK